MSKQITRIVLIVFPLVLFVSFIGTDNSVQKSDGGPPYNTNAPGETTCSGVEGANYCHSGGIPDNSGPGTPSIIFSGFGSVYVPGQTYTITPVINHPTRNRFGFQIVSLKDSDNLFTGTLFLLDTSRTRSQIPTWGSYQDRNYVMHRKAGSYTQTPNQGKWSYRWTAPPYNQGSITFYACFLAANFNNINDPGDETYYTKITIYPSAVGIAPATKNETAFSVYPNPADQSLNIECTDLKIQASEISIIDMQGRVVKKIKVLNNKEIIDVNELENGTYFLLISGINRTIISSKKIIIHH